MKIRMTGKGNIAIKGFQLTSQEIEAQALTDLCRYRKIFFEKYGKQTASTLDVENFVKELWGVDISYDSLPQEEDEEFLGNFIPESNSIVIDAETCKNPGRISFTIAHEAGHLSLHAFLFSYKNGLVSGWKNKKQVLTKIIERQADQYAGSLLAPGREVFDFLKEKGLDSFGSIISPVDMSLHGQDFQNRFGLSRMALEIRLRQLSIPMTNKKYPD